MARSHIFGLLAITLCLVACSYANTDESKKKAWDAVTDTKKFASKALGKARDNARGAQMLLSSVNTYKKNAEDAATEAEKAAKGNSEAEAIAQKAKKASAEALKWYPKAFELANGCLDKMMELRTNADTLYEKATNHIKGFPDLKEYDNTKAEADAIKVQVETLEKEMDNTSLFDNAFYARQNMSTFVKDAQLAKYHVDAIVAVSKVETLFKSAETDIELTEQKRDEINATVEEVKQLYDNSPKDLTLYIHSFYSLVQGHFKSASHAVEEAKKVKEDMLELKAKAKSSLLNVENETNVIKAEKEILTSNGAVMIAGEKAEDIKKKLVSATDAATNALIQKDNAVNALTQGLNITKDGTESPARSGNAITVSVSLLLALIACAALH